MANHFSHCALPYPIKGAKFTMAIPYNNIMDVATSPDTEISKDGGTLADATEEMTFITGLDIGYITFTATEMNCDLLIVKSQIITGEKPSINVLNPRALPVQFSGTATAGAAGSLTLASTAPALANALIGSILKTVAGTGLGQARLITGYNATRVATVSPNWETTPDATTTYEVLLTETSLPGVELADILLTRNVSFTEAVAGEHTLCTSILSGLEFSITATTLTIKRTDGTTTHYTKTLTENAAANPITGIT